MTAWVCRRQKNGKKCLTANLGIKQKCVACGGARPKVRKAKHMAALEYGYEHYVALTGADRCSICLRPRAERDRKFDRDHDHKTGQPRGLLCFRCNRQLPAWITPEWLDAAADYLRRTAA